jgi:hypothetical protein
MTTTEMIFEVLVRWPYNHPTRLLTQQDLLKVYELYTEERRGTWKNCIKEILVICTPLQNSRDDANKKEKIVERAAPIGILVGKNCRCEYKEYLDADG